MDLCFAYTPMCPFSSAYAYISPRFDPASELTASL